MTYTQPHKSEMIATLESLIEINKRAIDAHMRSIEILMQQNDETIKKIERIRNDVDETYGSCNKNIVLWKDNLLIGSNSEEVSNEQV